MRDAFFLLWAGLPRSSRADWTRLAPLTLVGRSAGHELAVTSRLTD